MGGIAVIGNLARDTIDGGAPRVGGAPYHAARGLRLLGGGSRIVARCGDADRRMLVPPLSALGVPVTWLPSPRTTVFEIQNHGEAREMTVGDPGAPWTVTDAQAVGRAAWVHVGGLTRADFPADVLAVLARDRRLALDGQALVRRAETGPLVLDDDFDPEVVRHLTALKLNEVELEALGGEKRALALGVPELLLTEASAGAVVIAGGVREHVHARRIEIDDPTGAGDVFLAAYAWARAAGHGPVSAARHGTTTAARVLELELEREPEQLV